MKKKATLKKESAARGSRERSARRLVGVFVRRSETEARQQRKKERKKHPLSQQHLAFGGSCCDTKTPSVGFHLGFSSEARPDFSRNSSGHRFFFFRWSQRYWRRRIQFQLVFFVSRRSEISERSFNFLFFGLRTFLIRFFLAKKRRMNRSQGKQRAFLLYRTQRLEVKDLHCYRILICSHAAVSQGN